MQFKKEYLEDKDGKRVFRIYTDTYGRTLAFLETLATEIKKSFPPLHPEDLAVVKYGGTRNRQIYGIEFFPPTDVVPSGWERVSQFDPHIS